MKFHVIGKSVERGTYGTLIILFKKDVDYERAHWKHANLGEGGVALNRVIKSASKPSMGLLEA